MALAHLKIERPEIFDRLRLHFVGTGTSSNDINGHRVRPKAKRYGVCEAIFEHPHRMPYMDVLVHLSNSSGILIVGSTESHYSPSKVYQSVEARRPIFALLHDASTAVRVIRESNAGVVVQFNEYNLPDPEDLAATLAGFVSNNDYHPGSVDWSSFSAYSARESARKVAAAMDAALAEFKRQNPK